MSTTTDYRSHVAQRTAVDTAETLTAQAKALADEAENLIPVVRDFSIRAYRVRTRMTDIVAALGAPDALDEVLREDTGYQRLVDALWTLADDTSTAIGGSAGGVSDADWLPAEEQARLAGHSAPHVDI